MPLMRRTALRIILVLGAVFTAAGCDGGTPTPASPLPVYFPIDTQFREYYDGKGGEAALGAALSPGFPGDGARYQYTVFALMAYNPSRRVEERYFLAPVGKEFNITWFSGEGGEGGISLYGEFNDAYDLQGGKNQVGSAITGPHYNPQFQRIEQLFEGMGFYRMLDEPANTVHMLAYGAWMCGLRCQYPIPIQASPQRYPALDPRFGQAAKQFGSSFTGLPVSVAYTNQEGNLEVVFENVLMFIPGGESGEATLSPVAERLGIMPEPLVANQPQPGFSFVEVKDQKGHLVPDEFMAYLGQHGGLAVSGAPIGELMELGRNIKRQCFTNLCLELDEGALDPLRIRPYALGYLYAQLNGRLWVDEVVNGAEQLPADAEAGKENQELAEVYTQMVAQPSPGAPEISLQLAEGQEIIKPTQRQTISVQVLENQQPKPNAQARLVLQLPKNKMKGYDFPPTGADGWSTLRLRPIEAPNNTVISYQVCTPLALGGEYCVQGEFTIRTKP